MIRPVRYSTWLMLLWLCGPVLWAPAGTVELRIKVFNPLKEPQPAQVNMALPKGIKTNHVVRVDSALTLDYDYTTHSLFVRGTVDLEPEQRRELIVVLDDVWEIGEEHLAALEKQADAMVDLLAGEKDVLEKAMVTRDQVKQLISRIRDEQSANSLASGVAATKHVATFERNTESLKLASYGVGALENWALQSGHDLETLLGRVKGQAPPARDAVPVAASATNSFAIIRIKARNPSADYETTITIRHPLPLEITLADIEEAGGLTPRYDASEKRCYMVKEKVTIPPSEEVTFDVKIRDKWNVNQPRIVYIKGRVSELHARIASRKTYAKIEARLESLNQALDVIAEEVGPKELNRDYIAFYRNQAERIDEIEERLNRIETVVKPIERGVDTSIGNIKLTRKTTWLLVFIILGFLALLSLLFFLRWYGKSKADTMPPPSVPGPPPEE